MKLIAYDLNNVIFLQSDDGTVTAYYRNGGPAKQIAEQLVRRLGLIGFKEVSIEVNKVEDAWAIVSEEAMKIFPS